MPLVQVEGIREFQAALRRADRTLPRELKASMDVIGREILVPEIQDRMKATLRGTGTGKLLGSVRAVSQQRAGIIKEGTARVPYAGWWEFGGHTKSPRGDTSREFIRRGRTLYPALDAKEAEISFAMEAVLERMRRIIDTAATFAAAPVTAA